MSRYIDADKIKYVIEVYDDEEYQYAFKEHIDSIPTANVREEIHGHWIFIGTIGVGENEHEVFRCSNCWEKKIALGMIPNNETSRFCPNCGAQMDEEIE